MAQNYQNQLAGQQPDPADHQPGPAAPLNILENDQMGLVPQLQMPSFTRTPDPEVAAQDNGNDMDFYRNYIPGNSEIARSINRLRPGLNYRFFIKVSIKKSKKILFCSFLPKNPKLNTPKTKPPQRRRCLV